MKIRFPATQRSMCHLTQTRSSNKPFSFVKVQGGVDLDLKQPLKKVKEILSPYNSPLYKQVGRSRSCINLRIAHIVSHFVCKLNCI